MRVVSRTFGILPGLIPAANLGWILRETLGPRRSTLPELDCAREVTLGTSSPHCSRRDPRLPPVAGTPISINGRLWSLLQLFPSKNRCSNTWQYPLLFGRGDVDAVSYFCFRSMHIRVKVPFGESRALFLTSATRGSQGQCASPTAEAPKNARIAAVLKQSTFYYRGWSLLPSVGAELRFRACL